MKFFKLLEVSVVNYLTYKTDAIITSYKIDVIIAALYVIGFVDHVMLC